MDGMNAMQGGSHLREIVPLLQQLWQGDVAHEGENWSFPSATSVPKPVQPGGPRIWIAARDPSSHDFAVANGCDVCCTPLAKDDGEVEDLVAKFQTACAAHPEVPRPRLMMLRHAFVVERDDQIDDAARAVKDWYAYFEKWIRNDGSVRLGHTPMVDDAELAAKPVYDLDAVAANNLIGTPEMLVRRLRRYQELGIDEVGLWLDNGRPHAEKRATLDLFIREVAAGLRVASRRVARTSRTPCTASWPQAASMSRPRERRSEWSTRRCTSAARNAATRSGSDAAYSAAVGL